MTGADVLETDLPAADWSSRADRAERPSCWDREDEDPRLDRSTFGERVSREALMGLDELATPVVLALRGLTRG